MLGLAGLVAVRFVEGKIPSRLILVSLALGLITLVGIIGMRGQHRAADTPHVRTGIPNSPSAE